MLSLDDNQLDFPESFEITDGEFVGYGGTLTPQLILSAYTKGVFPMFMEEESPVLWFCPIPRLILRPENVRIQKSIRSSLSKFKYAINRDFSSVIQHCATTPRKGNEGTWINQKIVEPFTQLHEAGWVHSMEAYEDGKLVGGLYGMALGGCFFGESMFQLQTNASKCALIVLCKILESCGFHFVDCQQATGHLTFMGGDLLPADDFFEALDNGLSSHNPSEKFKTWSGQRFSYHQLQQHLASEK